MSKKSFKLSELAEIIQCVLVGNPNDTISNVADIESATAQDASFLSNSRYLSLLKQTQAGVIFINEQENLVEGKNYLISKNPSKSFQQLIDLIHPQKKTSGFQGIHSTAVIHPSAKISKHVTIGPLVVIDEAVVIGENTFIGANSYIGPKTTIGHDCLIHPRVTIREDCHLGDYVIIQPGAVIGSCGFGYITEGGKHVKLNQVGQVIIENHVEIGANTTIDRARFNSTVVGEGTKIDNLVQIAHGVKIGKHNLIVAQVGIAGSTTTGKYVTLAGQVAVAGHLKLDDMVMVAGKSGVSKSLSTGKYGGIPAMKLEEYNRNQVFLRNIEKYIKQIDLLKQRIDQLEDNKT